VQLDYSAAGVPIRADLQDAHRTLWEDLRSAGTWWTGAERLAIAAESRHAEACALCLGRKAALSPSAVAGSHDTLGGLPLLLVEVAHRVRTDPGRLSRAWFDGMIAAGLDPAAYVEAVGIVSMVAGADLFARALGITPFPLPTPLPGAPTRRRPAAARAGTAWVPMIAPEDAAGPEADLYGTAPQIPNIIRALSLVPAAVRTLTSLMASHYVAAAQLLDMRCRRALDRAQMELVAARVSALNQCFY
jgi:hypothetical protein